MTCHSMINPRLQFGELLTPSARRTKDNNKARESVSEFTTHEGQLVRLTGPRHRELRQQSRRPSRLHPPSLPSPRQTEPTAYGPATLDNLQKAFAANNCNIQKLMIDIALIATEIK